jgi:SAM-dependent methyltransferase
MGEAVTPDSAVGGGDATPRSPEAWDRAATSYDAERAHDSTYQNCVQATTSIVQHLAPLRLIDVGCGTGLNSLPLCAPDRVVAATDYSFASLAVLQQKPGAPLLCQADLRALPFLSKSFDVVLCANTLQHLTPADQVLAVRELQRLVAPGGALVLTVHHFSTAKKRAGWIKEGRPGQPGIDYIFRFTADDLHRLLPGARIASMGISEWRLPEFVQRRLPESIVGRLLASVGYGHMLVAVQRASNSEMRSK